MNDDLTPDQGDGSPHPDFVAEERDLRLAKLEEMRSRGVDPYPVTFKRDHMVGEIRERHRDLKPDAENNEVVRIAGRLMLIRDFGGLIFADLKDQSGTIQIDVERETFGAEELSYVGSLDRGDWVGVTGTVMTTHTGELTVRATEVRLLSKSLRALPDKHQGLVDIDTRLRERYLDLIVNPETRRIFNVRSAVIASVRRTLIRERFTEVETPVLDVSAGGAAARPFITHHNALDLDMYLRIALELFLKRLVVGGFERVFEIGRVFRNEGIDTRHNPEFTLLEAYQALGDYHDMMVLTETIASDAAIAANGHTMIEINGEPVDLKPPWRRVTMAGLIEEQTGEKMHPTMPLENAQAICDRLSIEYEPGWPAGRLMSEVYDETGESTLVAPTFVCDYPREVSPLARTHRDDDSLTERFEAVVAGRELANAYTELNDPVDQRRRFEVEAAAKAAGDVEAESVDEDYIRALEFGLPPTGGLGIGLDRLVMLIAGAPAIRDVILFPTMRPEDGVAGEAISTVSASESVPSAASMAAAGATGTADGISAESPPPPVATATRSERGPLRAATARHRPDASGTLGWLTALAGLIFILSVLPGLHAKFGIGLLVDDVTGRVAGHVTALVIGLVLILVASQLRRGKKRAWLAASILFAAAAIAHVIKGPDPVVVIYSVVMLIALVWNRDAFPARPDPGSLLDVAKFIPAYALVVLTFGFVTLLSESEHVVEKLTFGGILETTIVGLAGFSGPYTYSGSFFSEFFPAALLALGIAGLLILSFLIFRAVRYRGAPSDADRRRAEQLVHSFGTDTLDYFALRPDKSYFFADKGDAMIAFTFISGYALVAADPIGAPGSEERVLDEFISYCRGRGWHLAFLAVREEDMGIYTARGFRGIYLGDEAIVRCDRFTLSGGAKKNVRSAVGRVEKTCTFKLMRESEASPELCGQLNEIRARWRGKSPERGFTMELGGGVRGDSPDFLLAVASGSGGKPLGFLRLVPCFGEDPGWSLDLMQRDPDAPNGMTEYLIANCALALGELGFSRLSMNFAAWGRLFDEETPLSPSQKLLKKVAEMLNPFFQIKSLRDFNEKFDPDWVPRSVIVEDVESMPKVGLLYATVEGFVNFPVIGRKLVPPLRAGSDSDPD